MIETSTVLRGGVTSSESVFHNIVSVSNLLKAWQEFKKSKRKKKDVAGFELYLEDNIFELYQKLISKTYKHNIYEDFYVSDPKRRHIHKATVADRVVHQAVFRVLYPIFDKYFIYDSYSSRKSKGTHYGVERAYVACRKVSKNWKQKTYVLKCDVRKFFDSVDHTILRELIARKVKCSETMELIDLLLSSFEKSNGVGLPLGNVTSQLFANVYLNELDQFMKHTLKAKFYFRYCDDFIIIHEDRDYLVGLIEKIRDFLKITLKLELHPNKVEIRPIKQGVDFLGYVILPHMVVLRTKTKNRIQNKIKSMYSEYRSGRISKEKFHSVLNSYLGIVSHCRDRKLQSYIKRFM